MDRDDVEALARAMRNLVDKVDNWPADADRQVAQVVVDSVANEVADWIAADAKDRFLQLVFSGRASEAPQGDVK